MIFVDVLPFDNTTRGVIFDEFCHLTFGYAALESGAGASFLSSSFPYFERNGFFQVRSFLLFLKAVFA